MIRSPSLKERNKNILKVRSAINLKANSTKEVCSFIQDMYNAMTSISEGKINFKITNYYIGTERYSKEKSFFVVTKIDIPESLQKREISSKYLSIKDYRSLPYRHDDIFRASSNYRSAQSLVDYLFSTVGAISDSTRDYDYFTFKIRLCNLPLIEEHIEELHLMDEKIKEVDNKLCSISDIWRKDCKPIYEAVDPGISKAKDNILKINKKIDILAKKREIEENRIKNILNYNKKVDTKKEIKLAKKDLDKKFYKRLSELRELTYNNHGV